MHHWFIQSFSYLFSRIITPFTPWWGLIWHVFNPVLIFSPFPSKTLFQPSLLLPRPPMPIERVSLSYPLVLSLRRAIVALSPEPGPRAISDSFCTLSPHPASPARHVQSALRGCFNCHFSFRRRVTSRSGQAGKRRATVIRGDEHNLHAAIITHTQSAGCCLRWAVPAFGSEHQEVLRSARP